MLPASQTPASPAAGKMAAARRVLVPVVVAVMLYTLLIGWGLLFRWVRPTNAYPLIALPCLLPVLWYGYGFLNIAEGKQDFGLLLSAAGWALVALALLIEQAAVNSTSAAMGGGGVAAAATTPSPAATVICGVLGLLFIVVGAVLSWQAWQRQLTTGYGIPD